MAARLGRALRITGAAAALSVMLLALLPGIGFANAPDPYQGTWQWPRDFIGTYKYASSFGGYDWMKQAVDRANTTIGHWGRVENPDFHRDPSDPSPNGVVSLLPRASSCFGNISTWDGCAHYSSNTLTWTLWFATEDCWTDGNTRSCSDSPPYDVETVALNELGHVNTLAHHPPMTSHDAQGPGTYLDAVVQAVPDPAGHAYGVRRSLAWADSQALGDRYELDPCYPPPCSDNRGDVRSN
jgi:hypothetical protein